MKEWFTADTHFTQERTLNLSKRPFQNVEEMDTTIIKKWNEKVSNNDLVNHLGDFGNYEKIKELNGSVRLIIGNYERKDIQENFGGDFKKFEKYLLGLGFFEVVKWKRYVAPMLKDLGWLAYVTSHLIFTKRSQFLTYMVTFTS